MACALRKHSNHKNLQLAYSLNGLACAFCHNAIQVALVEHDFLSLNFNVYSLPTSTSERLVNHDSGIGHAEALSLGASCQQKGTHRSCQAKAVCGDICSTHLQHMVDEQAALCVCKAAWNAQTKVMLRTKCAGKAAYMNNAG